MILAGCALALGLASCEMKNELLDKGSNTSGEMGMLDLSVAVNAANNVVTKAPVEEGEEVIVSVDADGFELDIKNADGSYDKTHTYDPENTTIELPVGDYTVTAHTPGEAKTTDTKAYYSGAQSFTITAGESEPVEVLCKMANTKIQVTFDNTLEEDFQSWTVTVTPAGLDNMAYPFEGTSANFQQPDPIYWMLPDNVRTIWVDFQGKNYKGNPVNTRYEFEKPVEADSEYWTAADALAITVKSEATTEDNPSGVNGVTIDAEVTWNELEDNVTIPVEGTPTEPEEPDTDPDEPGEPSGEVPEITLSGTEYTLPADASETVNATITAPAGLKSVHVQIIGGNDQFQSIADMLLDGGDLELIGCTNEVLTEALSSMQVELPKKGDKEYVFPVSVFFTFLDPNAMGATTSPDGHVFNITVTDANNESVEASLKVRAVAATTEE